MGGGREIAKQRESEMLRERDWAIESENRGERELCLWPWQHVIDLWVMLYFLGYVRLPLLMYGLLMAKLSLKWCLGLNLETRITYKRNQDSLKESKPICIRQQLHKIQKP